MNKYPRRKYAISAFSILFFALCFISSVSAQILKPGEIIYSRKTTSPNGSCDTAAIWAVGQDGSNDRFITQGLHPRISPNGRLILFKRYDENTLCAPFFNGSPQWWIRDLTTKQETQISNNFRIAFGHFFSPETNRASNQIMFDDTDNICRMNLDGTNRACAFFTDLGIRGIKHMSVRGGDGKVVVASYDSSFQPVGGLYTFDYEFSNSLKIPDTSYGDVNPSWSNDGQTIAYAIYPTNRAEPYFFTNLFKINPDGSSKTQLTFVNNLPFGEGFSYSLVWTKDNATIINAAKLNGVAGIYKIAADGSGTISQIPITAGAPPEWVGGIAPPYSEQQVASFGGGAASSGNYSLVDTMGQAFAGQTSSGGAFNLQSGFWTNNSSVKSPFDFDGDGKTDIAIFRPAPGEWWINRSLSSQTFAVQFGQSSDKLVPGDYTGDGKTDVAIWRPSTGQWFILRSEDFSFYAFPFGASGDTPASGDYDGDGKIDAAVFRPSNSGWYILRSGDGGVSSQQFGFSSDLPVPSDYDGDGKADIAIFRPNGASGGAEWWTQKSSTGTTFAVQFGTSSDKAVAGDYTGDGKSDIAFFRPSTGQWFVLRSENFSFYGFPFGASGDIPAPGDYDGDGKTDAAVFRPSNANWYVQGSTAGVQIQQFGFSSDRPIPNVFVP